MAPFFGTLPIGGLMHMNNNNLRAASAGAIFNRRAGLRRGDRHRWGVHAWEVQTFSILSIHFTQDAIRDRYFRGQRIGHLDGDLGRYQISSAVTWHWTTRSARLFQLGIADTG
jgi:hypothetical protein